MATREKKIAEYSGPVKDSENADHHRHYVNGAHGHLSHIHENGAKAHSHEYDYEDYVGPVLK